MIKQARRHPHDTPTVQASHSLSWVALRAKPTIGALVNVLHLGIEHQCTDDAQLVLSGLRQVCTRPEWLDLYDIWLAIKRQDWMAVTQRTSTLPACARAQPIGRAVEVLSRFAIGDPTWMQLAQSLWEHDPSDDVRALCSILLGRTHNPSLATSASPTLSTFSPASHSDGGLLAHGAVPC